MFSFSCWYRFYSIYHHLNTLPCQSFPKFFVCIDHQSLNKLTIGRKTSFFAKFWLKWALRLSTENLSIKIFWSESRLTSFPGMLCTCPLILLTLVFPVSASVLIWKMIIITKSCKEVRFRWHFFQYRICTHQNRHPDVNPTWPKSQNRDDDYFHISIGFSYGEYLQSLLWPRYCIHKYDIVTILENTQSSNKFPYVI